MATVLESNKTKIAKRVIEIFEFFDTHNRQATVMDIVRQYGRPQSSTSELLTSLVEMGLLYKDRRQRTYRPTPRLATLGSSVQPGILRDGRLFTFMDRLARSTRHDVALFGQVGIYAQIFRLSTGQPSADYVSTIVSGASERLSDSCAGQLLLSTLGGDETGKILRRLNAEASEDDRFSYPGMLETIAQWRRQGHATGIAGFAPDTCVTAVLVPGGLHDQPLAVGMLFPADEPIDTDALAATIKDGIAKCSRELRADTPPEPATLMRAV